MISSLGDRSESLQRLRSIGDGRHTRTRGASCKTRDGLSLSLSLSLSWSNLEIHLKEILWKGSSETKANLLLNKRLTSAEERILATICRVIWCGVTPELAWNFQAGRWLITIYKSNIGDDWNENDFVSLRAKVSPQDCITFRQVNYPSSEFIFKCAGRGESRAEWQQCFRFIFNLVHLASARV